MPKRLTETDAWMQIAENVDAHISGHGFLCLEVDNLHDTSRISAATKDSMLERIAWGLGVPIEALDSTVAYNLGAFVGLHEVRQARVLAAILLSQLSE